MFNIEQILSSVSFANKWREKEYNEQIPSTLIRSFFGARKQYEEELATIRGVRKSPITLSPSTKDANTLPLQRGNFEITKKQMPYFKNNMLLGEKDARRLADALNSKNEDRIRMVASDIYDDRLYLVNSARVTVDALLSDVLTTGEIIINDNGVDMAFDYGITAEQKKSVDWTDPETSTPIDDLREWIEERALLVGVRPDVLILNTKDFALVRNSQSIKDLLIDGLNLNKLPSNEQVKTLFLTELQVTMYICDDMYKRNPEDAEMTKHIPDGTVVLFHEAGLGDIVYSWTPEEISAELGAEIDFTVVDTGVCITAETSKDIVQTVTKVGVVVLPDLPGADSLVIASVRP